MSYLDEISAIWEEVKLSFRDRYAQSTIDMWFGKMKIESYENNVLTFSTVSELNSMIVREKYLDMIREGFAQFLGFEPEIEILFNGVPTSPQKILNQIMGTESPKEEEISTTESVSEPQEQQTNGALPPNYKFEYTFDNFIVGNSNKFAHAACSAVATRPARDYNPLFIYGPSGLGKTHLMSAVVNEIKRKKPDTKVSGFCFICRMRG